MKLMLSIAYKELVDALRDKRTMLMVFMVTIFGMPFMMVMMSEMANRFETQAEKKVIWIAGIKHAPELQNFVERQGYQIKDAPVDYEHQLQTKTLIDPVLVVSDDFQEKLAQGDRPTVFIVMDVANQDSQTGVAPLRRLMQGYSSEQAGLNLAMRGVSPDILNVIDVKERHLSRTADSGAQLKSVMSMMLMFTMISAGLYAAIDTSAGERERGSLEPLMMNPVSSWAFTVGKWIAVGTLTMMVVVFSVLSIFPASLLIRNETIKIMLQFSSAEMLLMILVLLPLGLCLAAVQIAIAINGKSHKEAQARCTILLVAAPLVSMIGMFKQGADPVWYKWVPLLSQNQLMGKILNNEVVSSADMFAPVLTCALITFAALWYTSKKMRSILM
ncbi:ABC transporter permease [Solimicrobium silvestre]|uniref:ABC-2 family transporter protein n=1 Tax=Solimicrobium silvestre TaxID=2099400 RepID=A0A2S9H1D0_9BURK|nr:ABC transporter permease [Solimicrobium silvestre]PRC93791.1 ABC-2 family transporter protein [Solimicrobium silvestre]